MSLGDVLLVAEDPDPSSYEAVGDAASAVYVGALHDDGVLYLGVSDGGVVSDARVGADEGVGADLAAVAEDGGPLIVVRLWMTVPSPIATLFVMVAVSSTVPWLYGSRSWRIGWFASRRNSGFVIE